MPTVHTHRRSLFRLFIAVIGCVALALTKLQAATVTAAFSVATDTPITAAGYTATGNTLEITLGFAPPVGTNLTVIKNTARPFISGTFSNVPNGSTVNLTYNGTTYPFVAWYYGGTGNDLVLLWPTTGLAAWGQNTDGQLGDTTTTPKAAPAAVNQSGVLTGKLIIQVACGSAHTLALTSDGQVYAWGENSSGQLGDGSSITRNAPVAVNISSGSSALFGKSVVAISAGAFHSLALCSDGSVVGWGSNGSGQLGDGTATTQRSSAVSVDTATGSSALFGKSVVAISAGANHSLALCSDGAVIGWGFNGSGQLGDGSITNRSTPVATNTNSGTSALYGKSVTAIRTGPYHSLALCSDGLIVAWGYNNSGQLGDGSTTYRSFPVLVNTVSGTSALFGKTVVAMAAGIVHSIALCSDGSVVTWGWNLQGQLGDGTGNQRSFPVAVNVSASSALLGKSVQAISAGYWHSAALCADGSLGRVN